ncbi:hypothetical protein [Amycolatopsis dongchuanensis]|uniref:Uncharacterized protein n=1 Tax=Amycolatopsis dongchuanensis TaxID=1070866 RepID=A0ABP8VMK8_9PSEU
MAGSFRRERDEVAGQRLTGPGPDGARVAGGDGRDEGVQHSGVPTAVAGGGVRTTGHGGAAVDFRAGAKVHDPHSLAVALQEPVGAEDLGAAVGLLAVMVKVAAIPPASSMASTWLSTTSLSQA